MGGTCRLRLLGPVQIERGGKVVRGFESRKALALLCYLAVHDRPLTRTHLADLFWSDKPEARGRGNLSRVLHNLTTLLPGCLIADRDHVQFQRTPALWLDVFAFEELAQGSASALTAAVDLYRDEFMAGIFLDDCPDFETWLVAEREQWRQRVVEVLDSLIAHHTERAEYEQGLRFASRLLSLDPWREEAHRQMMLLLARSGQRSAALAQYETCRRILAQELRVEPSAQTNMLFEQIRDGKVSAPLPPLPAIPHNLPVQLTPFVGREQELTKIAERLTNPDCRLLTLVGLGGIGKTRLALQAASANLGAFPDGVYFVSLAPIHSSDLLVSAIAEAMKFSFQGVPDPQAQLLSHLREKKMLLLMDNLEHLRDGVELLIEILQNAPRVKILVTSREHLDLQAEWLLDVVGLRDDSAVQLFAQRAERVRADFVLAAEQVDVMRICQLVERVPLAIELAAASARQFSCRTIVAQIERNLDFLATSMRDVPERHRSMRAVFDHSWNLLTDDERSVFRRVSVFRGGFDVEAAEAVNSQQSAVNSQPNGVYCSPFTVHSLSALVDKSLLRETASGRYEMHELLRQYAEEKLQEAEEQNAVWSRHLHYFVALAEHAEPELDGAGQAKWLQQLETEHGNLRATLHRSVEIGEAEQGMRLAGALAQFWLIRGYYDEGRRWLEDALARGGNVTPSVWAKALHRAGSLAHAQGDNQQAHQHYQQALTLMRELGDKQGAAALLGNLGLIARAQGDLSQARALQEEGLALKRELGDKPSMALSLNNLAITAYSQGDYKQARTLLDESLMLRRELGDRRGIAVVLSTLA
jgi:predicted ATPase/DNA-binding SARP family transcriptional activator